MTAFVELLRVARHGHGRLAVVAGVWRLKVVRATLAGHSECPLHPCVVRLQVGIGDRPIGQCRPWDVTDDRPESKVVLSQSKEPALPVDRRPAYHLRRRAKELDAWLLGLGLAECARVEERVGPEVVAVDIGELGATEALALAPGSTFERHYA